jgi:hypothetical protein
MLPRVIHDFELLGNGSKLTDETVTLLVLDLCCHERSYDAVTVDICIGQHLPVKIDVNNTAFTIQSTKTDFL